MSAYSWNFMIRWVHGGITRASHSRIAFLRTIDHLLVSLVLFSRCEKKEKKKKEKNISRSKNEDDTILQDALTWHYEGQNGYTNSTRKWTFARSSRNFFGMPKILPPHTKFLPDPEKHRTWSNDGLRCPHEWADVFTIRAEYEHFLYRVSIWCQLQDSLTPAILFLNNPMSS